MKLRDMAETFLHAAGEAPAVTRLVTNAALLVTVQAAGAGTWAALRGRSRATKRAAPMPTRAQDERRLIVAASVGGAVLLALWAALALLARVRRMPILTAYPLYGYALLRYLPVVTRTDHRTRASQPMVLEIVPPPASPVIQRRAVASEAAQATEPALAIAR